MFQMILSGVPKWKTYEGIINLVSINAHFVIIKIIIGSFINFTIKSMVMQFIHYMDINY